MATYWERIQTSIQAAMRAWRGDPLSTSSPFSMYTGLEDGQRKTVERMRLLWKYYEGYHKKHLKVKENQPDDNVTVNLSRRVINKGVSFLFGKPLRWELQEGGDKTPEEEMLDILWGKEAERMAFLQGVALNGGVTGMAYLQFATRADGQSMRLVNLDPCIVFPRWNPQDVEDVLAYELRYMAGDDVMRTIHSKEETGLRWQTWEEKYVRGRWQMEGGMVAWPWSFPMILQCQNLPKPNSFYGYSDLEDADLNDAINATASNINRTTRLFSHPILLGKKIKRENFIDLSQMILTDNSDADAKILEAGRDLTSSENYGRYLGTKYAEITNVPENDPERMALGAQSGFALKVLFGDLLGKTEVKRNLYGNMIVEACQRYLLMLDVLDNNEPTLHWADPLPADEITAIAKDKFELEAGLASKQTVASRRGLDWETEQKRMAEERQAQQAQMGSIGDILLSQFERGQTNGQPLFGQPNQQQQPNQDFGAQ